MRKIATLLIVLVLVLAVSFPVKAENQSNAIITVNLTFNGISTATCSLDVIAGNSSYPIVATVTLKHGSTIVKQWLNLTANGYMNFSDTANVTYGETYTMQITVAVNGVVYNLPDVTKTFT